MSLEPERGAFVFFSYAHRDKWLRDRLEDHLSNLKYRGLITTWYDREIQAGEEWTRQIDIYLNKASIILLLISSHFMASEYCYSREMKQALERHERREADVIPILLRSVHFTGAPFAKLQMLPTNGKPVMRWRDRDDAFYDIACSIERVAQKYVPPEHVSEWPLPQYVPPEHMAGSGPLPPLPSPSYGSLPRRDVHRLVVVSGCFFVILLLIASGILALLQYPTFIPPARDIFAITLGLMLLIAGIVAVLKAIGAIRARIEQRRAQEVRRRAYYEEAIAAYRRALRWTPLDGNAFRGMGNALSALERYDEALNAFLWAIQYNPTPAAYAGLGNTFAKLKRYSEAVAAYEKAVQLDPTVTLNHDDLIRSLLALGRKEEVKHVRARAKQLGYEDDS